MIETLNSLSFLLVHPLGFGMTETSGTTHFRSPDKETVPGSVGVLLSNLECKVGTV